MVELVRRVRFSISPSQPEDSRNGYAGRPAMDGVGAFYELAVACAGEVDPRLGYLIDIQQIDRAVRATVIPRLEEAARARPSDPPEHALAGAVPALHAALHGHVSGVCWRLSPYYSVEVRMAAPDVALLRQRFDFAASHRLHCPELSPEENRRVFGKCNNPNGHGHNYQVEPCVEVPVGQTPVLRLPELERLVEDVIIQRFDHKNLNEDAPEFRTPGGVNPSVENIAKVCFELLDRALRDAAPRVTLRSMTVWETDRTSAVYPAPHAGPTGR
ncbi:MAG: 6-carboxytetrahydropterin synthase [Planctomycetota bacterium]|nr:6-carboxytetrahydropterin synthase [Planctomycetota bacterium]